MKSKPQVWHWRYLSAELSEYGGLYKTQVSEYLRNAGDAVPDDVRRYLADIIDGNASYLRGSPQARLDKIMKPYYMACLYPTVARYFRYLRHHCGMTYVDAKENTCLKFHKRKNVSTRFIEEIFREHHIK